MIHIVFMAYPYASQVSLRVSERKIILNGKPSNGYKTLHDLLPAIFATLFCGAYKCSKYLPKP